MSLLATLGLTLTLLAGALSATPDPGETAATPLSTSCQCASVTCGNGSTSPACQVSCSGLAVCSCASCVAGSRASSISGQNACICQ